MNADEVANEYQAKSRSELLRLALDREQLTVEAQRALADELSRRQIKGAELETARSEYADVEAKKRTSWLIRFGRAAYWESRGEATRFWQRFRSLRPLQRLGVIAITLFLIAMPCWRMWQSARNNEMEVLYYSALTGDLESVRKLSTYRFSGGASWLEKLAIDRSAVGDARVAAIQKLAEISSANSRPLVPLLWIEVPYVVRHQSADFFLKRGCNDDCIRMTIDSLRALWLGRPTLEVEAQSDYSQPPSRSDGQLIAELRATTEADYLLLLNTEPCKSLDAAKTDYPNDSSFIKRLQSGLKHC